MPYIEPFRGILYNIDKVDSSKVVAPPYDIISPQMQDDLYRASEYNVVRLILGKEEPADSEENNRYTRARDFFNHWLKDKILIQDKIPAIYVYSQKYKYKDKKKTGLGFIARMEIEDPKASRVLPHENTFSKPKQDRLNLIRQVKANLSPIFTLFQDEQDKISAILKDMSGKAKPVFDITHEGARHKMWKLEDEAAIKKIQELMRDKDIFIADGHHRYEVATIYRDEMKRRNQKPVTSNQKKETQGYDYVMMYFSPMSEKVLTVLPTHRMLKKLGMDMEEFLKKLADYFDVTAFRSKEELFKDINSAKEGEYAFGMYCGRKFYLLKLKKGIKPDRIIREDQSPEWKRLDVSVLHGLVFNNILGLKEIIANEENVIYTRDPDFAVSEVDKGNCDAAFFLNSTKVSQVRDIARNGDRMPHKSTYFYPKLLSGLVINKLQ